jgi:hypothetical protein
MIKVMSRVAVFDMVLSLGAIQRTAFDTIVAQHYDKL